MKDIFALDVDGVVLDIIPGVLNFIKEKYGTQLTEDDVTDWDWDYIWSLPNGLDAELWTSVWNALAYPYPGAEDFIESLKDMYFHVVAISTRPENWKGLGRIARDAGERDFPQLGFDETYFVDKHAEKVQIINDIEALYMIEDNPKNAMHIGNETTARSFLMTRPWNTKCLTVDGAWERVNSYDEIIQNVCETF